MESAWRLLADDGELSVVIPFDCKARLESEAVLKGFFKSRECAVKTTPKKQPRRYLMAFRKHPTNLELSEGIIETAPNVRSEWYQELTKDFYL
jgi:tRNA1Val (adenine37-N6)-methyltransferase